MKNGTAQNRSLFRELLRIDLTEPLRKTKVPYLILQGDTDIVTPTAAIEVLYEQNDNALLNFVRIPNSGHMLGAAGMEAAVDRALGFCLGES